jgi:hypothetical protein
MRNRFASAIFLTVVALLSSSALLTRTAAQSEGTKGKAFDPHDLSGVWYGYFPGRGAVKVSGPGTADKKGSIRGLLYSSPEPTLTPWAEANLVFHEGVSHGPHQVATGAYPGQDCDPIGVPALHSEPNPMEFVQSPGRIVQFFEYHREWRTIWMNEQHPQDLEPTYMGHSVGKWDGDTLVVDTIGYNGKEFVDIDSSHRMSDAFHLVERYKRVSYDDMELSMDFYDPKAWGTEAAWKGVRRNYKFKPDWKLQEYYCTKEEWGDFDQKILKPAASVK